MCVVNSEFLGPLSQQAASFCVKAVAEDARSLLKGHDGILGQGQDGLN